VAACQRFPAPRTPSPRSTLRPFCRWSVCQRFPWPAAPGVRCCHARPAGCTSAGSSTGAGCARCWTPGHTSRCARWRGARELGLTILRVAPVTHWHCLGNCAPTMCTLPMHVCYCADRLAHASVLLEHAEMYRATLFCRNSSSSSSSSTRNVSGLTPRLGRDCVVCTLATSRGVAWPCWRRCSSFS
jgi:hypothetical protein